MSSGTKNCSSKLKVKDEALDDLVVQLSQPILGVVSNYDKGFDWVLGN